MKKPSWKYLAAACAACLLLFTLSAQAALAPVHFGTQVAKFDNLPSEYSVPYYYGGLGWYNFYTLDPSTLETASGYLAGLKSPRNVVVGDDYFVEASSTAGSSNIKPKAPYTQSVIYSVGYAFILRSAYLTAAWNDNLKVTVSGLLYSKERVVYTRTYTLSATKPTLVTFPPQIVDTVFFESTGGTPHAGYEGSGPQFAMDNLTYIILPIVVPFII